jgi:hypothetical protein
VIVAFIRCNLLKSPRSEARTASAFHVAAGSGPEVAEQIRRSCSTFSSNIINVAPGAAALCFKRVDLLKGRLLRLDCFGQIGLPAGGRSSRRSTSQTPARRRLILSSAH